MSAYRRSGQRSGSRAREGQAEPLTPGHHLGCELLPGPFRAANRSHPKAGLQQHPARSVLCGKCWGREALLLVACWQPVWRAGRPARGARGGCRRVPRWAPAAGRSWQSPAPRGAMLALSSDRSLRSSGCSKQNKYKCHEMLPAQTWKQLVPFLEEQGQARTLSPRLHIQLSLSGCNCLRMQSDWEIFHSERHLHTALSHTGMCLRVHKHRHFYE